MSFQVRKLSLDDIETGDVSAQLIGHGLVEPRDLAEWLAQARDQAHPVALCALDEGRTVGVLLGYQEAERVRCSTLVVDPDSSTHAVSYGLLLALGDELTRWEAEGCRFALDRADLVVRESLELLGARPEDTPADLRDGWVAWLSRERLPRGRTPAPTAPRA